MDDGFRASAYEASPECGERQCKISYWEDPADAALHGYYQHGNNPEAVLRIERVSVRSNPAGYIRWQFREFAERCHRYDEGDPIGPDLPGAD